MKENMSGYETCIITVPHRVYNVLSIYTDYEIGEDDTPLTLNEKFVDFLTPVSQILGQGWAESFEPNSLDDMTFLCDMQKSLWCLCKLFQMYGVEALSFVIAIIQNSGKCGFEDWTECVYACRILDLFLVELFDSHLPLFFNHFGKIFIDIMNTILVSLDGNELRVHVEVSLNGLFAKFLGYLNDCDSYKQSEEVNNRLMSLLIYFGNTLDDRYDRKTILDVLDTIGSLIIGTLGAYELDVYNLKMAVDCFWKVYSLIKTDDNEKEIIRKFITDLVDRSRPSALTILFSEDIEFFGEVMREMY